MHTTHKITRPVLFGEVLFDYFPNGKTQLGGAPFNVARHLAGFGENPLLMSCIGNDAAGHFILNHMRTWAMDTSGIATHKSLATGKVHVYLKDNGEIDYKIPLNQAFDFIQAPLLQSMEASLFYHGSLSLRQHTTKKQLEHIHTQFNPETFIDLNLRKTAPHIHIILKFLAQKIPKLNTVKMNLSEWQHCISMIKPNHQMHYPISMDAMKTIGLLFLKQYEAKHLIVTLGENGLFYLNSEAMCIHELSETIPNPVSFVGAGDAVSAVLILGQLKRWDIGITLKRACQFAEAICQIQGALPEDPSLYETYQNQWDIN